VSCFVVRRAHRGSGIGVALLEAAVDWAAQHRASVLDGHPVDTDGLAGTDEWYNLVPFPSHVEVLAEVDESTLSTTRGSLGHPGYGDEHPVTWCHYYDGGRAWLTTLGHDNAAWSPEPLAGDEESVTSSAAYLPPSAPSPSARSSRLVGGRLGHRPRHRVGNAPARWRARHRPRLNGDAAAQHRPLQCRTAALGTTSDGPGRATGTTLTPARPTHIPRRLFREATSRTRH
jgi:hypothetical protein